LPPRWLLRRQAIRDSLSNRSGASAAPVLSHKLHREAPVEAIDPETAFDKLNAPTQEGG
jgi:hypothetical protein